MDYARDTMAAELTPYCPECGVSHSEIIARMKDAHNADYLSKRPLKETYYLLQFLHPCYKMSNTRLGFDFPEMQRQFGGIAADYTSKELGQQEGNGYAAWDGKLRGAMLQEMVEADTPNQAVFDSKHPDRPTIKGLWQDGTVYQLTPMNLTWGTKIIRLRSYKDWARAAKQLHRE